MGSRFERVNLSGAEFRASDLAGAQFRGVGMSGVVMRGVELVNVDIYGEIANLTINGVDIGPLINAELDRRYPDRAKMRPTTPAGFRDAWDTVERLWDGTVQRARRLDPALLHDSVDGEWSFVETLRHLVFATDSWVRRVILGDPTPWDPLDLPWDEMGANRDTTCRLRHQNSDHEPRCPHNSPLRRIDIGTYPVRRPGARHCWPERFGTAVRCAAAGDPQHRPRPGLVRCVMG